MAEEITFHEKLGKGGYGSVYKCKNGLGETLAAKRIKNDETGITCLMEISIMTSFRHPFLNVAKQIHIENDYIYIFMDLADGDLDCLKSERKLPDIRQLQRWAFQLVEAVHCLHSEGIIHCDIKAANVLRYGNDVRLSDFTLATKKWYSHTKYRHNICTCTHRPLEVFLQRDWDESVDIWSLGCTLYEIAYGELLFPYQGAGETTETRNVRDKCVNCILDWADRIAEQPIHIQRRPVEFVFSQRNPLTEQPEYYQFNDLLSRMLRLDPKERATSLELMQHPFFTGFMASPYSVTQPNLTTLPESDLILYETGALSLMKESKMSAEELIVNLGREIFKRSGRLSIIAKNLRILASLYIASKLVSRVPIELGALKKKILEAERAICTNLNFRFCLPSS